MPQQPMTPPGPNPPPAVLPALRQDLSVSPDAPGEDGEPTWLLFDPLNNRYFRLGRKAFTMVSAWENGAEASAWLEELGRRDATITPGDLEELITFLAGNGLVLIASDKGMEHLESRYLATKPGLLKWLLTHYLYIRIPLVSPDRFLKATLPLVEPLFRPMAVWLIVFLGATGILMVIRQWDGFVASILHFFNLRGLVLFGVTMFFVKIFHELGHAYTAKRQGCRVPTMGIAFLVLYPFLYTDTTDAWRLVSRKQRLAIVTAGVKAELALACIATFCWSFLDDGLLRSAVFFIATTGWITSVSVNLSPFMRFDGYYALVDLLGAENLQPRAFALARWRLREALFGLNHPQPESLSRKRRTVFLIYAYCTWIYRFTLFVGIAFMVYHMTFKLLGIVLFFVEIGCFVAVPAAKELGQWWRLKRKMTVNRHLLTTLGALVFGLILVCVPWQTRVLVPAVLEADMKTDLYPRENGKLEKVHVVEGQTVSRGDILMTMTLPRLENAWKRLERNIAYLRTRMDRYVGSASDLDQLEILQKQMARAETELAGVRRRMDRGIIRAPHDGVIKKRIPGREGQWVSRETLLAQITGSRWTYISAYVQEDQLARVHEGAKAVFFNTGGDLPPLTGRVVRVYETAVPVLPHLEAASLHGGPIAVRPVAGNQVKPESGVYRAVIRIENSIPDLPWRIMGTAGITAPSQSPIAHFWRYAVSVLIRESDI